MICSSLVHGFLFIMDTNVWIQSAVTLGMLLVLFICKKKLVFGDEFLAPGLHLSHTRGVQLGLGLVFLQTSQVLPH